jgi:transposase-like protein
MAKAQVGGKVEAPRTLLEAVRYFSDPDVALAFVVSLRWPTGEPTCPRCGSTEKHSFVTTRRVWKCRSCRKTFSAKVGTIFEDSPLGWDKWLPAMWLLANSKNSVSSHELARALGVTQKTSWFMLHRVRDAMATKTFEKLDGVVEGDETFVGGKLGNMHKAARDAKGYGPHAKPQTPVVGLVQRGGEVRAKPVPDVTMGTLFHNVFDNVEDGTTLYTDQYPSYKGLEERYAHKTVDHGREYVSGDVHINTMENFWSLLKRSIKGTQVHIDPEHLHRYVDERAFAYNNRTDSDLTRMRTALSQVGGKRLTYANLIAHD